MDADRIVEKEAKRKEIADALLRAEKRAKMIREGRIPPVSGKPIKTDGVPMQPYAMATRG